MGRGRKPRQGSRIAQSEEATRLLKDDVPVRIKWQLRLAVKGGRAERRKCLGCGHVGTHCKVWSAAEAWTVEAEDTASIKVYWLCPDCHARYKDGLSAELEQRLRG